MTTLTFAFTRGRGATLRPGDRSSAPGSTTTPTSPRGGSPAEQAGAEHVLAAVRPGDRARCRPQHVIDLIDERTKWVDVAGRVEPARHHARPRADHRRRPRRRRPGVRRRRASGAPPPHRHRRARLRRAGDLAVQVVRPARGMLWMEPELLDVAAGVQGAPRRRRAGRAGSRPARPTSRRSPGSRPRRASCSRRAWSASRPPRSEVFAPLLDGLQAIAGVTVWRRARRCRAARPPPRSRSPGCAPAEVSAALAAERIAVWDGHNYAVEVVEQLGLAESAGWCVPVGSATSSRTMCAALARRGRRGWRVGADPAEGGVRRQTSLRGLVEQRADVGELVGGVDAVAEGVCPLIVVHVAQAFGWSRRSGGRPAARRADRRSFRGDGPLGGRWCAWRAPCGCRRNQNSPARSRFPTSVQRPPGPEVSARFVRVRSRGGARRRAGGRRDRSRGGDDRGGG